MKLKTYNKTVIIQLGTCMVTINYKYNKKNCDVFVVPRNSQALLGMQDTAALKIINVNIDSKEAGIMWKGECNTNIVMPKSRTPDRKLMWQRRAVQTCMKI